MLLLQAFVQEGEIGGTVVFDWSIRLEKGDELVLVSPRLLNDGELEEFLTSAL